MITQEHYAGVARQLEPYQDELSQRLELALDACCNIQASLPKRQEVAQALAAAYLAFLDDGQHPLPAHLGEPLNHIRATAMALTEVNQTLRAFCLAHLPPDRLTNGLEATADFQNGLVQAYLQTHQGVLQLAALSKQEQRRLKAMLTEREVQVLAEMIAGKTNQQIAATRGVTVHTVVNYLQRIRQKLNTRRRSDTIAVAVKLFKSR